MADSDKTEVPTGRRRQEAREKGQVAKSMELNTAFILIISFYVLRALGPHMWNGLAEVTRFSLANLGTVVMNEENFSHYAIRIIITIGYVVLPFILIVALSSILINILQVGFMHSTSIIKPKFSRINPINGMKRFFSYRILIELVKSVVKITLTAVVAYQVIKPELGHLILAADMDPIDSINYVAILIFRLGVRIGLVFAAFAAIDYWYQRWEHERGLRMTKMEVKEELIRYEGRPEVRSRVRSIQRQLAMRRMMQEVPKADVVITNPTHLAVALQYNPKDMAAPKVVAKGARLIAERIIAIAKENNVPVMENKPLARLLFKMVDIGKFIPLDLYQAVADILAFVWRTGKLKKKFF